MLMRTASGLHAYGHPVAFAGETTKAAESAEEIQKEKQLKRVIVNRDKNCTKHKTT
jgi:hypothetical protein